MCGYRKVPPKTNLYTQYSNLHIFRKKCKTTKSNSNVRTKCKADKRVVYPALTRNSGTTSGFFVLVYFLFPFPSFFLLRLSSKPGTCLQCPLPLLTLLRQDKSEPSHGNAHIAKNCCLKME